MPKENVFWPACIGGPWQLQAMEDLDNELPRQEMTCILVDRPVFLLISPKLWIAGLKGFAQLTWLAQPITIPSPLI